MGLNFKRIAPAAVAPAPVESATILPVNKATEQLVAESVQRLNVEEALGNALLDQSPPSPETFDAESIESKAARAGLSQLVDDDFPFDPSQLDAINGILAHRYACMTGAAGTGKTTCTKKIVQEIHSNVGTVDMKEYFKRGSDSTTDDPDDDYEVVEHRIPSIVAVGFTGRSTQQIKRNFPRDWHPNIMTIHRCLAYAPEYYEDFEFYGDSETEGEVKMKMRFVPTYTSQNKLPWDVIIIDEAGMVGLELWHNLFAALKDGCRIIMIGDINQLPPVHGKSIFGFALGSWPAWELTHVHRQQGTNVGSNANSIVDNAWRVINGNMPVSDLSFKQHGIDSKEGIVSFATALVKEDWKFASAKLPEDVGLASVRARQFIELLGVKTKLYDPIRDTIITAINGHDESRGMQLGQLPLNQELAIVFNKSEARFIIDAGRERKRFAVGDKVMATRNDHEAGITNGMTGIIESITRNAAYTGDYQRFGEVSEVAKYLEDIGGDEDEEFSLEDIAATHEAQEEGKANAKEKKDRGPASHIVTVRFGEGEHSFEIAFGSLAEVASLMTAYVVTCHKMQGGESPVIIIICHQAHRAMLFREWLYTAVTRASMRCIVLYTDLGMRTAIAKQKIVGKTMMEKVESFQALQKVGLLGAAVTVSLQKPVYMNGDEWHREKALALVGAAGRSPAPSAPSSALSGLMNKAKARQAEKIEPIRERVVERVIERVVVVERQAPTPEPKPAPKFGGTIFAQKPVPKGDSIEDRVAAEVRKLEKPIAQIGSRYVGPKFTPTQLLELADRCERLIPATPLLTYQPVPESLPPVPVMKKSYASLGALIMKGKKG